MDSLTNLSAPNPSNTTTVYAPSSEFSRADEILVRNKVQQIRDTAMILAIYGKK